VYLAERFESEDYDSDCTDEESSSDCERDPIDSEGESEWNELNNSDLSADPCPSDDDDGDVSANHVAVKRLNNKRFDQRKLATEVRIMRNLVHPNIVRLDDVVERGSHTYLILELVPGGELFDFVVERGFLRESMAATVLRQMASAIAYMHSRNVIHRDIKPENVLISEEDPLCVKISDFGLSAVYGNDSAGLTRFCGSVEYTAPEILVRTNPYGCEVDAWSFGIVAFVVLAGHLPFAQTPMSDLVDAVSDARYSWPCGSRVGWLARDLVEKCLTVDRERRLTAEAALEHSFLIGK
jgi:serine/threonine protein kinase